MCTIAPERVEHYCLYVITPIGDRWDVENSDQESKVDADIARSRMEEIIERGRVVPSDDREMRDTYRSLVRLGVDPSTCTVHVVRHSDETGEHAENGWETVN